MKNENGDFSPDLAELRSQILAAEKWAYLDHAAVAPLPIPAKEVLQHWAEDTALNGNTVWLDWDKRVESARRAAAELINADIDEIALVNNTTQGINFVAEGLHWREGDNVVTLANEFPANLYPWMNQADRGVETRLVPVDGGRVDLDRIAAACDSRTRVVSVSWVSYASGWRLDLDRLAEMVHDRGALLFVDAIQGLGVFELDVRRTPVDFISADGHKWLLGPEGAGVCFIRGENLEKLRPAAIGWRSVENPMDFERQRQPLRKTASRYEGGSQCLGALAAMGASIELLSRFGPRALSRRVIEITDYLCERLRGSGADIRTPREPLSQDKTSERDAHKSGIVTFAMPDGDPQALRRRCLEGGVALSCRAGGLRASAHAYNNESDVERLIDVLR